MGSQDDKPRPMVPGGLAVRFVGGYQWTDGRVDDSPVVVLLHGCGARADDLVPLAEMLSVPDAFRFALPAAPLPLLGAAALGRPHVGLVVEHLTGYVAYNRACPAAAAVSS